ncbi:MAG TPA: cytochrome c oxidase subunit II [Capillimicrobium sp.]|nr:cytochrome c oxidase subunit II [Capillimicrobium sp.]
MRRPVVAMVLGGLVASAIGIVLGLAIDWFPTITSAQADQVETLYDVLVIASVPIFVLVMTVVISAVIRFRMRPGQENEDGPPIHGNTTLEVIWTVLPALLILGLCAYSYVVLQDVEDVSASEAAKELNIGVTGQQFAWTFTYPQEVSGGDKPLSTTELVLPIDRSVKFDIQSKDVIHDFWVPDFSMKIDAVPGITTHYRVTPERLGTYPIVCAELCGLGHSVMRNRVRVVSEQDFQAWLQEQSKPAAPENASPAQLAAAGKQIFTGTAGCGGCHTLADAGTTGQIGPDLDQVLKGASEEEIRTDIVDPNQTIAKGYGPDVMPGNFEQTLSPSELDALVAYLEEAAAR